MKFRCTAVYWAAFGVVAPLATPQTPTIFIAPHGVEAPHARASSGPEEKRVPAAGAAVLGYVAGLGPTDVYPIFGTAKRPQIGAAAIVPDGSKRLYLPPRQQYVLVEQSTDEALAVWALHRAVAMNEKPEPIAVKGAMAHPDAVAFSPRGDAAVLYSQATGTLQVLINLPAEPSLSRQFSMAALGAPSQLAITDDGVLVVAALPDRSLAFSLSGRSWQPLALSYTPQAWTFIPKTHDLAIGDSAQKTILLLANVGDASKTLRLLSQDVPAERLAITKNGDQLVAVNFEAQQIWTIDLKTGTVTPKDGFPKIDTLSSLRDGFTFLLSATPSLSLLKLTALPDPGSTQVGGSSR